MGTIKDIFKKIGNTKGTLHAKMGTIKDRNGKELTEAEKIKNRWQKYTELNQKVLNDLVNHNSMVLHLEPDILEYEVKWVLGTLTANKTSEGDGIPTELFHS